jgi:hypothetical protein
MSWAVELAIHARRKDARSCSQGGCEYLGHLLASNNAAADKLSVQTRDSVDMTKT